MKRLQKKHVLGFFAFLLFAAVASGGGYYYWQYEKVKKDPTIIAQQEAKFITGKIRAFIDIPKDEQPSIATITDIEKLKDQPFFKKAKNGDKLIIYSKIQKAILYRPTENKIVDFTLVDTNQVAGVQTENPTPEAAEALQPVKIALYNGTGKEGLTNIAEQQLKSQNAAFKIIAKANAAKKDYQKTLIVDVSGKRADQANALAQALNGEIASLPSDEKRPNDADMLVILGNNFNQ